MAFLLPFGFQSFPERFSEKLPGCTPRRSFPNSFLGGDLFSLEGLWGLHSISQDFLPPFCSHNTPGFLGAPGLRRRVSNIFSPVFKNRVGQYNLGKAHFPLGTDFRSKGPFLGAGLFCVLEIFPGVSGATNFFADIPLKRPFLGLFRGFFPPGIQGGKRVCVYSRSFIHSLRASGVFSHPATFIGVRRTLASFYRGGCSDADP